MHRCSVLGESLGQLPAVWAGQGRVLSASYGLRRFELPGHGGAAFAARAQFGR